MDEIRSLVHAMIEIWRGLNLGLIEKNCILGFVIGVFFYVLVLAIEYVYKTRTDNYRSREFFHDTVYWFYYRSGLNYILFISVIFPTLDSPIAFLDFNLLTPLPVFAQALVFFVASDFIAYWVHRAMHHFKFLWAFHTTHHAPERITFATSARFHPMEIFVTYIPIYVLIQISGSNPMTWLPVMIFIELMLEAQHTQIPWQFGPFYKVFVTPTFHWYHHSPDRTQQDMNFGAVLSVWDNIFGTALKSDEPLPDRLGLEDVKQPSVWSSVMMPFWLVYKFYGVRDGSKT